MSAQQSKSKKRFRLFVDPAVQGALARRFCFHWASLAFCLFVLTAVIHILSSPFDSPEKQLHDYWMQHGKTFVVLALLTPAFIWDAIKLSNRFAGPVSRLRRSLQQLGDGEQVGELKFRGGDFWQDLAVSFNRVRNRVERAEQGLQPHADSEEHAEALEPTLSAR